MYEIYKDEIIECPFCCKTNNIYYIKQHMKSKGCQEIQKQYKKMNKKIEYNKKMFEHNLNINKIKSNIKLDLAEELS